MYEAWKHVKNGFSIILKKLGKRNFTKEHVIRQKPNQPLTGNTKSIWCSLRGHPFLRTVFLKRTKSGWKLTHPPISSNGHNQMKICTPYRTKVQSIYWGKFAEGPIQISLTGDTTWTLYSWHINTCSCRATRRRDLVRLWRDLAMLSLWGVIFWYLYLCSGPTSSYLLTWFILLWNTLC